MKYWKVLNADGTPCHGGTGRWPLPVDGHPGAWLSVRGLLKECHNGLHLCRRQDLIYWLGPVILEVETDSDVIICAHGVVVDRARLTRRVTTWTERTARLFAADCAESVLPLFESFLPDDDRPRVAIATARAFVDGNVTRKDLAAARAAAGATRTAAGAAALAARGATGAVAEAVRVVGAFAQALRAAARKRQTDMLFRYLYPAGSE